MLVFLWERTPDLLIGFGLNWLISALSMVLGMAIGFSLALARNQVGGVVRRPAQLLTSTCRNIPSFVLIFYLAFVLPVEISVAGQILTVPLWLKATLALTIPVIGFTSDQGLAYLRQRREGLADARSIFAGAALQYFLIVLMSSATASVIGVEDSVGRMNQMIAYETTPTMMLLGYSYIGLFFITTSLVLSRLARRITT